MCQSTRALLVNTAKTKDGVTDLETVDPVPKLLKSLPPKLSKKQREAVADLLYRYENVFSKSEFVVGLRI